MKELLFMAVVLVLVSSPAGLTGCGPGSESAERKVVRGEVIAIDSDAMTRDGDGVLCISAGDGRNLTILIPSGEGQPQAAGLDLFPELKKGDVVEVAGEQIRENELRVWRSSHYLRKITP